MSGISPSLPLTLDPGGPGYKLNKTLLEVVKQNFKNLVLTSPGERIMIPDFGVGIRNYVFEQNDPTTFSSIRSRLSSQTRKYMPFITIRDVSFDSTEGPLGEIGSGVQISINYEVLPLSLADTLKIKL